VKVLVVVNDQPYGSERPYNALRLAGALSKREEAEVRVFLMHRAEVACCGTCLDARGLTEEQLVDGARRSTLDELTDWTLWADQTLTF
jgi:uncharacterized protein involved in oxidation of intracellular sulfur